MIRDRQIAQIVADKRRFFWTNSRSFSFASLGFTKDEREIVASVYAFCRVTDDLVDEHLDEGVDEINRRVDEWLQEAKGAFEGTSSGLEWLDSLMIESARRGVPWDIIELLVEGVREDTTLRQVETVQELRNYCYYVASTVGVWICHLFGVHDPWMLQRAEALGRAMQITNILRDVGEDLVRDRVYIPIELLDRYGLTRDDLVTAKETGELPAGYAALTQHLMKLADENYALAWEAIPRLPRTFGRAAAVAADVYRGIHERIASNGYDNFSVRAYTGTPRKIGLMLKAICRLWSKRLLITRQKERVTSNPPSDRRGRPPVREAIVVLLALTTCWMTPVSAQVTSSVMDQVRDLYWSRPAADAIEPAQILLRSDTDLSSDPIAVSYDAALEIVKAKHRIWPGKKLEHLNNGLPVLDSLVAVHPSLTEVRFLRLISCYFLPALLKREWSVEEDVKALAVLLPDARMEVPLYEYKQMLRFVLQNGEIGDGERRRLMAALEMSYRETMRLSGGQKQHSDAKGTTGQ